MLTSVFGISIKYEAWNQQDSLPVYIAGSYVFTQHIQYLVRCSCNSCGYVGSVFDQRNIAL